MVEDLDPVGSLDFWPAGSGTLDPDPTCNNGFNSESDPDKIISDTLPLLHLRTLNNAIRTRNTYPG